MPTVKWFKNGVEVTQGNKYEIITEQFSSILTVKNLADNENNQTVSCVILNPLGKETSEAFIKIIGLFINSIKNKFTKYKIIFNLSCSKA